jgi:hypothetical protein
VLRADVLVNLSGQFGDHLGEFGVALEFQLVGDEVMVSFRLLKAAWRFCPIMTNVDRKMASSETTKVSVGQGLFSTRSIQTTNARIWA